MRQRWHESFVRDVARPWIVTAACTVTALGIVVAIASLKTPHLPAAPRATVAAAKATLPAPPARPFLMFISLAPDEAFKHVVLASLDAPDGPRYITPLQCERVYYAGSRGLCRTPRRSSMSISPSSARWR